MKVHHLNLCTMCPFGGRWIEGGEGTIFAAGRMVVHALLVEVGDGLVLVDTGMGLADVRDPARRLGRGFLAFSRPALREAQTAVRQVEALGFSPKDVRDVVVTHLDVDHAGGIPDFPHATIHVHEREHQAAVVDRKTFNERNRYRKAHFAESPSWKLHEEDGEKWLGFDRVRAVGDDVLMIPLFGHTRGHCAVAVRAPASYGVEWLLHCGDAYFNHGQLAEKPTCPPALELFQKTVATDNELRLANTARLRELHRDQSRKVKLFSAHDPYELDALTSAAAKRDADTSVTAA